MIVKLDKFGTKLDDLLAKNIISCFIQKRLRASTPATQNYLGDAHLRPLFLPIFYSGL
jgi:hypothetical protein